MESARGLSASAVPSPDFLDVWNLHLDETLLLPLASRTAANERLTIFSTLLIIDPISLIGLREKCSARVPAVSHTLSKSILPRRLSKTQDLLEFFPRERDSNAGSATFHSFRYAIPSDQIKAVANKSKHAHNSNPLPNSLIGKQRKESLYYWISFLQRPILISPN